jgi:hypothetical protein
MSSTFFINKKQNNKDLLVDEVSVFRDLDDCNALYQYLLNNPEYTEDMCIEKSDAIKAVRIKQTPVYEIRHKKRCCVDLPIFCSELINFTPIKVVKLVSLDYFIIKWKIQLSGCWIDRKCGDAVVKTVSENTAFVEHLQFLVLNAEGNLRAKNDVSFRNTAEMIKRYISSKSF